MKYKDYKFTTSSESIELTYDQACAYFEENLDLIEKSEFQLFNDEEELTLDDARKKYNEINRRLQTFGQSFELFMKYIIHAARIEKDPKIKKTDLWNKWIRGHQMFSLINEKASSQDTIPDFRKIFNSTMNSFYGFYGCNYIRYLGSLALEGIIEPSQLFTVLQPHTYPDESSITDKEIDKIIADNTAIYEKCRYNVENMTNYNFGEVFDFISFLNFFAKMIHVSKNKTQIDYNVAYVHAMADDAVIKQLLTTIRTEKEIKEILNDESINKDSKLLAYLLTENKHPIELIRNIVKMDRKFENPEILYQTLQYNFSVEKVEKFQEKGIDLICLANNFTTEQVIKLIEIPVIGEYLNKNPLLVNKMITDQETDFGLTFDDWYRVLNNDALKKHPEYLKNVILNYRDTYHCIAKNDLCNSIFALPGDVTSVNKHKRDGKTFSKYFSDILLTNISNNINFFENTGISDLIFNNISVALDMDNIKKIYNFVLEKEVNCFPLSMFYFPFNEVYAVINSMGNKEYDFTTKNFPSDFKKEYDSHAKEHIIFKDLYLPDEFLESNGLIRISEERYYNPIITNYIKTQDNTPLPNLKK